LVGNRNSFDKTMKKAAGFAWKKDWSRAIKEYNWALKEFPDEPTALTGLGIAYSELNQLQDAQQLFRKLILASPDDTVVLTRLADVEEKLGENDAAGELLLKVGGIYETQGVPDRALEAWQRAARLAPTLDEPHHQLARAFTSKGELAKAALSHLAVARVLQVKGRVREAAQAVNIAIKLDPENGEARALRDTFRDAVDLDQSQITGESGPIESARQGAWAELARMLFEDMTPEVMSDAHLIPEDRRYHLPKAEMIRLDRVEIIAILGRAVDLDSQGNADGAVEAYQRALRGGVDRVAVHFALGLLYRAKRNWEDACSHLAITTFHPDYALAAHLALGDCYQQHGRMDVAVQHFVQALQVADLRTVDESRAMDIAALYGSLTDGYRYEGQRGREQAIVRFVQSVRDFFRDRSWSVRATQLRQHLDAISIDGATMSLAEGLGVPGFEEILHSMNGVQQLINRGMLLTAREECYRAIEQAPGYLPLHLRLADIFIRQGMIEDAVAKYSIVAAVYEVCRDYAQAINVYRQILSLMPLDVKVRSTLIDLLINRRDIDQAIEQYLVLADAYYQQARVDKAIEKFNEALRLTSRSQDERAWRLKILYFIGDLYNQRVDWKKAAETYEQILALAPEEDQAALYLMDLYFKQNQSDLAIAQLQQLLKRFEANKDSEGQLKVLREAARLRPNEMAIRARLSQVYIERGMKQEAISELDALGEMQLEGGLRDQAIQTIRLIISLKPANVRAYKQLLYHLLS
jgi:tetratricopeptide (TPR) repeat protein